MATMVALALSAGCQSDGSDNSAPPDEAEEHGKLSDADLERLQMLGYEPWVEEAGQAPAKTSVTVRDAARIAPGYTLYASRGACEALLIDDQGKRVHSWRGTPCGFWEDVDLLEDGSLLVVGAISDNFSSHMRDRFVQRRAWDSTLLWESEFPGHHEISRLADGRLLALSYVDRELEKDFWIVDDHLLFLSREGQILEQHSIYDLFQAAPDIKVNLKKQGGVRRDGHKVYDLFHTNAAEWVRAGEHAGKHPLYKDGNIVVSMRNQNFVGVIDREAKRFVWGWGKGELEGPHSARLLANGHVLVFDNGRRRKYSRILEVNPLTNQIVWSYEAPNKRSFFTEGGGAARRLANGNTLIAETRKGRLFEITGDGEIVWDYLNPVQDEADKSLQRATIYSAERLAPEFVEAILKQHVAPQ